MRSAAIPVFTVVRRSFGENVGHVSRPFSNSRATACRNVYSPSMPSFVSSEGKTGLFAVADGSGEKLNAKGNEGD